MKALRTLIIPVLVITVVAISQSVYVVKETERAVKLEFGAVVEADVEPGLHFKIPIVNSVTKFDARILTLDAAPQSYLTSEKKALTVDSFVKWKVSDVEKYYTTTGGDEERLRRLLIQRVDAGLRNEFGSRTVNEVVSGERDELMGIMLSSLNESVKDLGVEIIDFRVKRIDLPSNLSNSVYERMRTERQRLAEELRSEGKEIAREIRAVADKDKVVILAEAYKLSEQLRGEGDAEAAGIYAEAFSQDPEFYEFTRSMKAYVETFESKSDVMLIDSDSEFFKYLNDKKDQD